MTNTDEMSLPHSFELKERSELTVTGVTEVVSFDEESITLSTSAGGMTIEGSGLKISRLSVDRGELTADGHIDAVYYFKTRESGNGIFSRLFR